MHVYPHEGIAMRLLATPASKWTWGKEAWAALGSMAALAAITGCAGPIGTLRAEPPGPPPVTAFDGSYRNTLRQSNASSAAAQQAQSWCQTPGQPVITVANGQFTYAVPHPGIPGTPSPVFQATFAQDGSFVGQVINGTMSGHVNGSRITGKIDGQGCIYTFEGNRI
jgi:hypothetical protein